MPYLKRNNLCPEPIDCKILTAALSLIVSKGYQRVSINDIQKTSSVSIGSIYNHFGGKEGVAKALYTHLINELDELVDDVTTKVGSPTQQCTEIVRQFFQYTESHTDIVAFLFNSKHSDFIDDLPSLYQTIPFIKIKNIIQNGIDDRLFTPDESIVVFSGIFGSAIQMIQLRLEGIIEQPLTQYHDSIIKVYLNS